MGTWEEKFVYSDRNIFADKMIWWGRYIDDIILFWSGSETELLQFHSYLNNTNRSLKLSRDFSSSEINFLDLKITKEANGDLHTSIFRKTTDRNTILRPDSFHPSWLKNNIPFGQFQRLKRICDTEEEFERNAQDMHQRFKTRGYQKRTILRAYNKAKCLPREQLLVSKEKNQQRSDNVYFVTQYSNHANKIKRIIERNWDLLKSDSVLREALPDAPTISFRRAPTLNDKLVKVIFPPYNKKHGSLPEKVTISVDTVIIAIIWLMLIFSLTSPLDVGLT